MFKIIVTFLSHPNENMTPVYKADEIGIVTYKKCIGFEMITYWILWCVLDDGTLF